MSFSGIEYVKIQYVNLARPGVVGVVSFEAESRTNLKRASNLIQDRQIICHLYNKL